MKEKLELTNEEKQTLRRCFNFTWEAIGYDVEQGYADSGERMPTGENFNFIMIETVLDCERICNFGKLPKELWNKLMEVKLKPMYIEVGKICNCPNAKSKYHRK